ncbi:hypothetical protein Tco_0199791 [Tanacetum coccineum]
MEFSNSNSKEREPQLTQRLIKQRHSHCMAWFEQLETHLCDLYLNSLSHAVNAFKLAFHSFFGEEHETFRLKMFHNLNQLRLQLERENLLERESCILCNKCKTKQWKVAWYLLTSAFTPPLLNNDLKGTSIEGGFERAFSTLFEQDVQTFTRTMFMFLFSRFLFDNDEGLMICKYFIAYIKTDVPLFHDKLIQHIESLRESIQERAKHKRGYDRRINDKMKQSKEGNVDSSKALDAGLVVTESNETESERHVSSSRSGKDTHAEDGDINSMNDKQLMAEVQLTVEHNILANEQQLYEQSESIYDTYFLEKVDRNTTPDLTDMSHRGGEIDQNAVKCQVSCPLLDLSFDNMTTKFSNQSLESGNISLKKTVAQLQKDFSRMEAHCVNMELKYQNQALKDGQHGQILNETSNKAKIKKEIEVLETINIELEHSVAKLLAENEKLHKENEHLKQTYKDLYDSIKKTRVQTKDHNDSLIAQINSKTVENANLKAQIQEKVFANVALKNELRKLKGNSVDTKFAKPSILGKPVLQPPRNQSVVRQPNAFKSE